MRHVTVLKNEAISYLNIKPNGVYVDGTLGGGGHSKAILDKLETGFLYAFDQDEFAIEYAKKVLGNNTHYELIQNNFKYLKKELNNRGVTGIDGLLLDLGLSSFQIDDPERGFSYLQNVSLDMRMDQHQKLSAKDILNTYSVEELARIFYIYGEEKNSYKIAQKIVANRPLEKTFDLVAITDKVNHHEKGHSAKRVFQALRIAVNDELDVLQDILSEVVDMLNPGGRIVIITFHSLEDRIVKQFFKSESEIILPKDLPVKSNIEGKLKVVTHKPIYPSEDEMNSNSRSKSAKMRVAEKRA